MRDLNQAEQAGLEALIDSCGLSSVLMTLSDICDAKAEHIRTNWQDQPLARHWDTACGRIGVIIPSIVGRGL